MKPYRVNLTVIKGAGRGKIIGVPTYNFSIPADFSLKEGIYGGWLYIGNTSYPSAIHYGPRPTFGEDEKTIEVHVIGDTLPQELFTMGDVEFTSYIREVKTFENAQDMMKEIKRDIETIRSDLHL